MKLPLNILSWIEDNKAFLKPPVGNKVIMENDELLIMAVGGPNARNDYHFNEGTEFFYQIKGSIQLRIQENGRRKDIVIQENEIYLLPPRTPHSPMRPADTIGLVIERKRNSDEQDGLQWYCEECNLLLFEKYFKLNSIENDFLPVFKEFNESIEHRTCADCGHVTPADLRYV